MCLFVHVQLLLNRARGQGFLCLGIDATAQAMHILNVTVHFSRKQAVTLFSAGNRHN